MQANRQYSKYKPKLKKHCIVLAVASGVSLLAAIFLVFLPIFRIDLLEVEFTSTTLPKLENLSPEVIFSANPYVDFSIYDEVVAAIGNITDGGSGATASLAYTVGLFQIAGVLFLAMGVVASIVSLVTNVLHALSPDVYALDMYDKIKRRMDEPRRRRYYFSSSSWIIVGIVYEVLAIFLSTYLGNLLGDEYAMSYFSLVTGVNGWCVLTIIFLIGVFALFIWAKLIKRNVRISIMREEYSVNSEEPFSE